MTGNRKRGAIRSLSNLNEKLDLGYTQKQINEMSTGQLRKAIGEAKLKHNIPIPNHSKFASKIKTEFSNMATTKTKEWLK